MKHFFKKQLIFRIWMLFLTALLTFPAYGQETMIVKGTVTDAKTGEGLIGVSVVSKDSPSNGAVTDMDGAFSLSAARGTRDRKSVV